MTSSAVVARTCDPAPSASPMPIAIEVGDGAEILADAIHDRLLTIGAVVRVAPGQAPPPDVSVVVSCADGVPEQRWRDLEERCVANGADWYRCHIDGGRVHVGPFVGSRSGAGRDPGVSDVEARRRAASPPLDRRQHTGRPRPSRSTIVTTADLLADDIRSAATGRSGLCGFEATVDGTSVRRRPVFALPTTGATSVRGAPRPVEHLIDPWLGVIRDVREDRSHADLAPNLYCATADVADTRAFATWRADAITSGASLENAALARAAAIGEAVERYCANAPPADATVGSASALRVGGGAPLDPASFALYSSAQYSARGFPFVPFDDDLAVPWVPGVDLATGAERLAPVALTHLNVPGNVPGHRPAICTPPLAGVAAGATQRAATLSALLEVVERDAVTLWWAGGASAPELMLDDPVITEVLAGPAGRRWRHRLLRLPSDVALPVVVACVEDPVDGLVGLGSACRVDAVAAARKALSEAMVSVTVAGQLADPNSAWWRAVAAGTISRHPYAAFRPARDYRHAYRADWRDLTSLDQNVQLYLDPELQGRALHRVRHPAGSVRAEPPAPEADPYEDTMQAVTAAGLCPVAVDVTTSDVRTTSLRVVRVVVPGTYQLAPAAFPPRGGHRLPPDPDDLIDDPLPFS